MKLFRPRWLLLVSAATILLLSACGGGGGDGGDDRTIADQAYTGVRTQAYLDANNAEALVLGAYWGGDYGVVIPLTTEAQSGGFKAPSSLVTLFEQTAAQVKQGFDVKPQSLLDPADMCVNYPEGSTTDNLQESDSGSTATVKGDVTFSNCDVGEGIFFDGTMSLNMTINLDTFLLTKMAITMNPLSASDGTTSFTLYGTVNGNETRDNLDNLSVHLTINATLEDPTAKTYWLNNYKIDDTEESLGIRETLSGRYYDDDYGYVDFTTIVPIFLPYNPADPSYDGWLEYTGSEGSNATLQLGPNESDYCITGSNASGLFSMGPSCAR